MFAHSGSTLYVRFGDNSNPGSKTLRTSPNAWNTGTFFLYGNEFITLKNLEIRGCWRGVSIKSGCNDIIVEDCTIYATGRSKVLGQPMEELL